MGIIRRWRFIDENLSKLKNVEELLAGDIVEFKYDSKKKIGTVGGWKTDKRPRVLVIFEDSKENKLYGINLNYIPYTFAIHLLNVDKVYTGKRDESGAKAYYKYLKMKAPSAVKKGYRTYMRNVMKKNAFLVEGARRMAI